jgi:hypothetical protein
MYRCLLIAAVSLMIAPAAAGELADLQAESIDLGGYRGVVYYTNDHGDYRVVTTIAEGETGLPVRFEATLSENQKLTISVPAPLGEKSHVLELTRAGAKLVVAKPELPASQVIAASPQRIGE